MPHWLLLICVLLGVISYGTAVNKKDKFHYADLESCQEYDTMQGYGYHDYFAIENITNAEFPGDVLRLNLFVLAARDAHILLSPTDQQEKPSAVYEIVLGAGGNTFVEIRRQKQTQPLRTIRVKNILSAINPLPLTIRITADGLIDVSSRKQSIINATDKNPLTIKYISFSSWGNTEGKWFYDCAGDGNDRLDEVIRERSAIQILRDALFSEYDIHVVPMNLSQIEWAFMLKYADFADQKSQLTARGKFKAAWFDPKLVWNPRNYSDINSVYLQAANDKMWTPRIRLINGLSDDFKSLDIQYSAIINSSGYITAETKDAQFVSWCNDVTGNWPIEQVQCSIVMMFNEFSNLEFSRDPFSLQKNDDRFNYDYDEAQYHVVATAALTNDRKIFDLRIDRPIARNTQFTFSILMERNGSFYAHLFVTPLLGSTILILLSLWTEGYLRVTLNSIGLLIVTAMHILLADYGPHGYVPALVIYYNCLLVAAWATMCLFIINCCIKECAGKVGLLVGALKIPWLRLALGMDVSSSYEYKELQDEPSPNDDLRKLIDRIAFLLLILIFGIFMALGY